MSTWLEPIRRELDAQAAPVRVFCRDDDAGWDDPALARLLEVCGHHAVPLDLAVIPAELTDSRASWLLHQRRIYPARLGLHQHGWAHLNHEAIGRKCEFGAARPSAVLHADVARGQHAMRQWLGRGCDPIFTPPWNRCATALGPILVELGFSVLSRDASAPVLGTPGLTECAVHVDWSARRHGKRLTLDAIAKTCAAALHTHAVVGLLFHHAAMDIDDLTHAGELLRLFGSHPCVGYTSLLEAASTRTNLCEVIDTAEVHL